ncbi:MAG: dTDP-4-dehydrorhamnose reductase [Planctomycetota bacterium]
MPVDRRNSSTVAITGATGLLGGALVRQLLAAGFSAASLRCLVRSRERAERSGIPPESIVLGALEDLESLERATEGAEVVFHLAATLKARSRAAFDAVNARGTEALIAAMRRRAPGARLVLVSSLAAAGPSVDGRASARMPGECRPVSHYGESKRQGELAVLAHRDLPWTIVRPPVVYGAGDAATRLLFQQARALLTFVPRSDAPLSIVHVDDVARALVATVDDRASGAILPLDGPDRTTTHAMLQAFAAACGRRARLVPVPLAVAAAAARLAEFGAGLFGRTSFFNPDKVREIAASGWVADGAHIRALLGFAPEVDLATGLRAVARAEGLLPGHDRA